MLTDVAAVLMALPQQAPRRIMAPHPRTRHQRIDADSAREIYSDPRPADQIADARGISASTVRHIKAGRKWAKATGASGAPGPRGRPRTEAPKGKK